mmetsp:Transcript_26167/g.78628  ORF Transcript_26167/g.78628 Transcript_26167/m.78628 type:complete len:242 (+) Transcript_26167:723-1448(+)
MRDSKTLVICPPAPSLTIIVFRRGILTIPTSPLSVALLRDFDCFDDSRSLFILASMPRSLIRFMTASVRVLESYSRISFHLNAPPATITIEKILSSVSSSENAPIRAKSFESASSSTAAAIPQHMPVFTAGGSRDAEIATPTSPPELSPAMDMATPRPDGMAIARPYRSASGCPRFSMKSLGSPKSSAQRDSPRPTTKPMAMHNSRLTHSANAPLAINPRATAVCSRACSPSPSALLVPTL